MTLGGQTAYLEYTLGPHRLVLLHTEVPPALEGRGVAARLARHALDLARREGLGVTAECPFVHGYAERHPEYRSLLLRATGPASAEPPWME
ncbi:MAG: GNAT family N-acetyltransferase [Gemmatimonadota bacterium]